jgi:hypothetical protein
LGEAWDFCEFRSFRAREENSSFFFRVLASGCVVAVAVDVVAALASPLRKKKSPSPRQHSPCPPEKEARSASSASAAPSDFIVEE